MRTSKKSKVVSLLLSVAMTSSLLAGSCLSAAAAGPMGGPMGPGIAVETPAEPVYSGPVLLVEGEIYGSANTEGGSCLTDPSAVTYSQGVDLVLSPEGLDDHKIDSSQAKVELVSGDGYLPSELKFKATELTGDWQNGRLHYTLSAGDLTWNNDAYPITAESACGREWSCFGGDGSGNYYFRLQVSGIRYDGQEIPAQIIPLHVYIYGRSATDLAVMNFGTLKPAWSWNGTGDKPILCDHYADTFTVQWPAGIDGSRVEESDLTIVLQSQYGDQLTLKSGDDYNISSTSKGETEIQITYQNWAFTPVYNTMTLTLRPDHLIYDANTYKVDGLSFTTDIASVYAYGVQSGGAMPDDHAVCFTYYGVELDSWEQVQTPSIYRLQYQDEDGNLWYYASKWGIGYLTSDLSEAQTWDATGPEEMNYQLVDNHMVYLTLLGQRTETKSVGFQCYTFTKVYDRAFPSNAFDFYGSLDPCETDGSFRLLPGYALPDTWLQNSMWAWKPDIGLGWVG